MHLNLLECLDPEKLRAIRNYREPTSKKQLRELLGMINWYRRHMKMVAKIQGPLTSITSEKAVSIWGPERRTAFEKIKEMLFNAPVLTIPDYNLPFILYTDACDIGIRAVVTQKGPDREYHLTVISRLLNKNDRNYITTE